MNVRLSRSRVVACCVALLGALLGFAGCGDTPTTVANPPANTLDVVVSVHDSQNAANTTSGATTNLAITLSPVRQGAFSPSKIIEGSDAKTLVCDGGTQLQFNRDHYEGNVPTQTSYYTCAYFWNNGSQSASIFIPVLPRPTPHIEEPTSGATIPVPTAGDPGVTISYGGSCLSSSCGTSAQIVATASDYNKRPAATDSIADVGRVIIPAVRFPDSFSIGWGTITLTRTFSKVDITARASNAAFHSVTLEIPDQVVTVPVRWL